MFTLGKNIFFLYLRLIITMCLSLYTSRILLSNLGVENFGIYNLVGGIVVMMAFLNNAMTSSTQRFLSFKLNDDFAFKNVFLNSKRLHFYIAVLVFVLAEIIGSFLIYYYLDFGNVDKHLILIVYQFSIFSFLVNIISVPYLSVLLSKQNMNFYAGIGIIEGILKFGSAYILIYFKNENVLIYYSLFVFITSLLIVIIHIFYVSKKYMNLVKGKLIADKRLIKEMMAFAGWNLIGVFAGIGYNNGVNILLNVFFGVTVNASRAIAFQVQNAVNTVINNLLLVFNPNIIKNYAVNDKTKYMHYLYLATKLSFFLIMIMVLILYINLDGILGIWLKVVPQNTSLFLKIILIDLICVTLSNPLHTLIQASGKIKNYQIIISIILLLNLPISYMLLKFGFEAYITFIVALGLNCLCFILRLSILKYQINFNLKSYFLSILLPSIFILAVISMVYKLALKINHIELSIILITLFVFLFAVLFVKKNEYNLVFNLIKNKLK